MPVDIKIPSPGESITEVTIGTWLKQSGEWIDKDEPVVEIESDKVTLEIPAPESGQLEVLLESGTETRVGSIVGRVDASAKQPEKKSQSAKAKKQETGDESDHVSQSATAVENATREAAATHTSNDAVRATPVARKIAEERGVDLGSVQGTGPSGRVRKSDVLAVTSRPGKPHDVASSSLAERGIRREKMTKLRLRIAERLVAAQHTAAMLTTFNEADMSEVIRLRKQHKENFEKLYGVGLGFMSFFVKACVSALQRFQRVNSYIVGNEIEFHDFVDMSIAVGTDRGLVVPIIRNADQLTFAEIEETIKDLATRARDGKLTIDEMTGGTFTISNGGIYGSLNSTPILNPPQSGILGLHRIMNRPIEDPNNLGQIALRPMMHIALSYDHRIVDGAEAVSFLVHVKNAIENPERLLLGL